MIEGQLGGILEELGRELGIPNLGPDEHGTCLLKVKNGIRVQIEMLKSSDYVLIASDLGEIPPGRYRIDLFESALSHNVSDEGGIGTFGLNKRSSHLLLFKTAYIRDLNGMKINDIITPLAEKAKLWKEAVTRGEIPSLGAAAPARGGVFGLMR